MRKNSRAARASAAFTVSYTAGDPLVTQQVVQELVDLYLAENERAQRKSRGRHCRLPSAANGQSPFRPHPGTRIQACQLQVENAGMLPEEMEFNTQLLDRTQNQFLELMRQAQAARERQAFLQSQLLTLEPQAPVNSAAPETLSPKARLRLLKAQYSTLLSKYGDKHPDVVRMRRQIDAMSASGGDGGVPAAHLLSLEAQFRSRARNTVTPIQKSFGSSDRSQAAKPWPGQHAPRTTHPITRSTSRRRAN